MIRKRAAHQAGSCGGAPAAGTASAACPAAPWLPLQRLRVARRWPKATGWGCASGGTGAHLPPVTDRGVGIKVGPHLVGLQAGGSAGQAGEAFLQGLSVWPVGWWLAGLVGLGLTPRAGIRRLDGRPQHRRQQQSAATAKEKDELASQLGKQHALEDMLRMCAELTSTSGHSSSGRAANQGLPGLQKQAQGARGANTETEIVSKERQKRADQRQLGRGPLPIKNAALQTPPGAQHPQRGQGEASCMLSAPYALVSNPPPTPDAQHRARLAPFAAHVITSRQPHDALGA